MGNSGRVRESVYAEVEVVVYVGCGKGTENVVDGIDLSVSRAVAPTLYEEQQLQYTSRRISNPINRPTYLTFLVSSNPRISASRTSSPFTQPPSPPSATLILQRLPIPQSVAVHPLPATFRVLPHPVRAPSPPPNRPCSSTPAHGSNPG